MQLSFKDEKKGTAALQKIWLFKRVRFENPIPMNHKSHIIRDTWFNNWFNKVCNDICNNQGHRHWLVPMGRAVPSFLSHFPSFFTKTRWPRLKWAACNLLTIACMLKFSWFNIYRSLFMELEQRVSKLNKLLLNTFFSHLLPEDLLSWLGEEA